MGRNDAVAVTRKTIAAASEPRWWIATAALWCAVTFGFALALALSERVPWLGAIFAAVASTIPAVLLGAVVSRLTPRFAVVQPAFRVLLHAVAATLFAGLWSATIVAELAALSGSHGVEGFARSGLAWQFMMGLVVYAVLVALATVRQGRERERRQQRVLERSETLRLRAELDAVRARLDPHFLFNALQTLGALIEERPSDAHRALEYLSNLLRRRLDNVGADSDLASFDEELRDAREYLALARLSLGERLGITEDVADETLTLLVPRFSVQALVENAIRHGIAPRKSGGCISIGARITSANTWTLTIADDGLGASNAITTGQGIGLATLRERLRIHFDDRASVDIQTSTGSGYRVTIGLPRISDDGAVHDD